MSNRTINKELVNATLKTIFDRRSVRKYLPQMVDDCLLEQVLAAGCMAPSAMNRQPWKFYVVTHHDTIVALSKAIAKVIPKTVFKALFKHPVNTIKAFLNAMSHPIPSLSNDLVFHGAPVVIFITSPKDNEWAGLDTGMCAQNMMLAAKSLGLDSCPIGMARFIEQTELFHRLEIPADEAVQIAIILGYGAEMPEPHSRARHNIIYISHR